MQNRAQLSRSRTVVNCYKRDLSYHINTIQDNTVLYAVDINTIQENSILYAVDINTIQHNTVIYK